MLAFLQATKEIYISHVILRHEHGIKWLELERVI